MPRSFNNFLVTLSPFICWIAGFLTVAGLLLLAFVLPVLGVSLFWREFVALAITVLALVVAVTGLIAYYSAPLRRYSSHQQDLQTVRNKGLATKLKFADETQPEREATDDPCTPKRLIPFPRRIDHLP
ncbi:MAG TPA: hypothetical protein VJC05_00180 [Candidatus Andersenbacteria bacterium]|nr:hypothetical protein [Candidatus Andersenbacteria bacterium]